MHTATHSRQCVAFYVTSRHTAETRPRCMQFLGTPRSHVSLFVLETVLKWPHVLVDTRNAAQKIGQRSENHEIHIEAPITPLFPHYTSDKEGYLNTNAATGGESNRNVYSQPFVIGDTMAGSSPG